MIQAKYHKVTCEFVPNYTKWIGIAWNKETGRIDYYVSSAKEEEVLVELQKQLNEHKP